VVKEGVTADELQKVKNQRLIDLYRQQETINGKAALLGITKCSSVITANYFRLRQT
jgi:hypothetical protein